MEKENKTLKIIKMTYHRFTVYTVTLIAGIAIVVNTTVL